MPLNHFMCLGFIYCLQKKQGGKARHFNRYIFCYEWKKKKQLKRNKVNFILGKCLCLAQILSLNVVLTFCGFRTLMTCVMVPVLNAGTMLLLGDRSCSWNVWWGVGETKSTLQKIRLILCQRYQQVKSDTQMMVQLTDIPPTKFYLFSR